MGHKNEYNKHVTCWLCKYRYCGCNFVYNNNISWETWSQGPQTTEGDRLLCPWQPGRRQSGYSCSTQACKRRSIQRIQFAFVVWPLSNIGSSAGGNWTHFWYERLRAIWTILSSAGIVPCSNVTVNSQTMAARENNIRCVTSIRADDSLCLCGFRWRAIPNSKYFYVRFPH